VQSIPSHARVVIIGGGIVGGDNAIMAPAFIASPGRHRSDGGHDAGRNCRVLLVS